MPERLPEQLLGVEHERRSAICTVSGGLDSAVAAASMHAQGYDLTFVFYDWGQKTIERERECSQRLAEHYGAKWMEVEVPVLKQLPGVSLTQAETQTVAINEYVPNRNAILETQTVAIAEAYKAGAVCVGSTGGDHICPDNSPDFIKAMNGLVLEGTMLRPPIVVHAPLINTDKIGAVAAGLELEVPFEHTWSCHNNTDKACGKCSNCESRIEAFEFNGVKDPIEYV